MVSKIITYVVVQFHSRLKFYFSLFLAMVMLIMSLKQWEKELKPRRKLDRNI